MVATEGGKRIGHYMISSLSWLAGPGTWQGAVLSAMDNIIQFCKCYLPQRECPEWIIRYHLPLPPRPTLSSPPCPSESLSHASHSRDALSLSPCPSLSLSLSLSRSLSLYLSLSLSLSLSISLSLSLSPSSSSSSLPSCPPSLSFPFLPPSQALSLTLIHSPTHLNTDSGASGRSLVVC
jgi:hypothetical protein